MAMTPTEEIMMMGQRADVPRGNPNAPRPPQGAGTPPPSAPPEAGAMEAMAALMGNEASLGSEMDRQMPEDSGQMMAEDAGALAEAVVGRAGGDVRGAIALLDNAKAMLMASAEQPQMAATGGGLMRRGDKKSVGMYQDGGGIMSAEEAMRQLEAYRS